MNQLLLKPATVYLGWTLVHFVWQGAAIALLARWGLMAMRRASGGWAGALLLLCFGMWTLAAHGQREPARVPQASAKIEKAPGVAPDPARQPAAVVSNADPVPASAPPQKRIELHAHWFEIVGPSPVQFDWLFGQSGIEPEPKAEVPKGDLPGATLPDKANIRVLSQKTIDQIVRLSAKQAEALLKYVEAETGSDVLAQPAVITVSGREAVVSVSELKNVVVGVDLSKQGASYHPEPMPMGPSLKVMPIWKGDTWEINLNGKLTEFLGYLDAGTVKSPEAAIEAQKPMPEFRVREVTAMGTAKPGESLFLRMPATEEAVKGKSESRSKRKQENRVTRRLYLLVNIAPDK
jgi:hypothetical protein